MPVILDPDSNAATALLSSLPAGAQAVTSADPLRAWLSQHTDEYVVVLGPGVEMSDAVDICSGLRISRPTVSVVLVREELTTEVLTSAMHAGARDVVPRGNGEAVAAAVARAHQLYVALRGPSGAAHVGKVVTVWSPKGGVGKTTMAVNLALALTAKGARKVCIVDLDLAFGDVAITLQLFPTHSIEHAIGSEDSLDPEMVETLLTRHADSLMILAAPTHPDVRERVSARLVSGLIRTLKRTYDYIVIDTPPAFDETTLTALDETDEIAIVATLDVPTLKNVKVALETLDMLGLAHDHRHLLLNRADDAVGINADRVEGILGMKPAAKVATSMDIAAATNAGVPIVIKNPTHPTSAAINSLAQALAGQSLIVPESPSPDQTPAASAQRGRLWKRR